MLLHTQQLAMGKERAKKRERSETIVDIVTFIFIILQFIQGGLRKSTKRGDLNIFKNQKHFLILCVSIPECARRTFSPRGTKNQIPVRFRYVILPLNVTLAMRSHLPRRWETVFRCTMKAIVGPEGGRNLVERACCGGPGVSLWRTSFPARTGSRKIRSQSQFNEVQ